jgi:hypothetical protein
VFGVWRKNLVMRDHQTGTIWQHVTGEAIDGPLKGCQLGVRNGWETTWGMLRKAFPGACYALPPSKFTGLMPKPVLQRVLIITHWASLSGLSSADARLGSHEVVIGVVVNGTAKAYPLDTLRAQPTIVDQVRSETIRLVYDAAGDQVTVSTVDGTKRKYERQWWTGWSEFHPCGRLLPRLTSIWRLSVIILAPKTG